MGVVRGTVYFTQHREVTSPAPHYLIVLNTDTDNAPYIAFGVVTSGIELAKKRVARIGQPPETLVFITPSDYPELDHDSVVDCNDPVKMTKWEFDVSFAQISATRRSDMPEHICKAIVEGVKASSLVPKNIKKLLG